MTTTMPPRFGAVWSFQVSDRGPHSDQTVARKVQAVKDAVLERVGKTANSGSLPVRFYTVSANSNAAETKENVAVITEEDVAWFDKQYALSEAANALTEAYRKILKNVDVAAHRARVQQRANALYQKVADQAGQVWPEDLKRFRQLNRELSKYPTQYWGNDLDFPVVDVYSRKVRQCHMEPDLPKLIRTGKIDVRTGEKIR